MDKGVDILLPLLPKGKITQLHTNFREFLHGPTVSASNGENNNLRGKREVRGLLRLLATLPPAASRSPGPFATLRHSVPGESPATRLQAPHLFGLGTVPESSDLGRSRTETLGVGGFSFAGSPVKGNSNVQQDVDEPRHQVYSCGNQDSYALFFVL